jgi:hypothetical protein
MKLRQPALQSIFPVRLDIFYPPKFWMFRAKEEFFNAHWRLHSVESRGVNCLESMNLGHALSSLCVGRRPMSELRTRLLVKMGIFQQQPALGERNPRAPVPYTPGSDLSSDHQIQLGFIPIRNHFQVQWLKEGLKLLLGGK